MSYFLGTTFFKIKTTINAMIRYRNLSGTSSVYAYDVGINSIIVQFSDGSCYEYDQLSPGFNHIEQMKQLAQRGQGLGSYINRHVRKNYARKLR